MTEATIYKWKGTPETGEPMEMGRVWVEDGVAKWKGRRISFIMHQFSTRYDPQEGETFVDMVVQRIKNPPYLWAEQTR